MITKIDFIPVIVDCQTTGGNVDDSRIIELSWHCLRTTQKAKILLAKPGRGVQLSPQISRLTGIEDDDLNKAHTQKQLFTIFSNELKKIEKSFDQPVVLVAHFASFEKRFLDKLWQRNGRKKGLPFEFICTHKLAKRLCPGLPSYSLRAVVGFLVEPIAELKRSATHVEATTKVWRNFSERLKQQNQFTLNSIQSILSTKQAKVEKSDLGLLIDKAKRLSLPSKPGVYFLLGRDRRVLYVGKAKNLRSRVSSHFTSRSSASSLKKELLGQVSELSYEAYESELHAKLEEIRYIKELRPPYNKVHRAATQCIFFNHELDAIQSSKDAIPGKFKSGTSLEYLEEYLESIIDLVPLEFEGLGTNRKEWAKGVNAFLRGMGLKRRDIKAKRLLLAVLLKEFRRNDRKMVRAKELEEIDDELYMQYALRLRKLGLEIAKEYRLGRLSQFLLRVRLKYSGEKKEGLFFLIEQGKIKHVATKLIDLEALQKRKKKMEPNEADYGRVLGLEVLKNHRSFELWL